MDSTELAQDGIERAHHAQHAPTGDRWTLCSAMLIAALAAGAVLAEMSANDAQTHYLASYIGASDTWAQYQAKSVRRTIYLQSVALMTITRQKPADIQRAQHEADRLLSDPHKDGMTQLAARAHEFEVERDIELRLHDAFEHGVRGLQIAVVLTSLSIATRIRWLILLSAGLGLYAAVYSLLTSMHVK